MFSCQTTKNGMVILKRVFEEMCPVPMHWILVAPNRDNCNVIMKTATKLGIS